jgi:hypothetical protein
MTTKKGMRIIPDQLDKCIFLSLFIFLVSCRNFNRNNSHPEISDADIRKGQALASKYCQGCHSLPDPSLLDSKHWEQTELPYMGPRLGIFNHGFDRYPNSRSDKNLSRDFYPSQPLIDPKDWEYLMDYYIATSPDSLPDQQRPMAIKEGLNLFQIEEPKLKYYNPATCLLQIDTNKEMRSILVSDAIQKKVFRINAGMVTVDSVAVSGPVVGIDFQKSTMVACDIGVLNPNNGKFGKGLNISIGEDKKMRLDSIPLFDLLARPVQITASDLNQDGLTDYLVCEFGHLTGALSWFENMGNGRYQRHVIRPVPGAIKAYINDYNHDGLPDLWVLFGQGDEGIFLFTNQGKGKFLEKRLLSFPAIYGSSYFELDDFNHDGFPDILYTCGDNADYSVVLKPYHGVYIFLNDGQNHFTQKYFFPINGCYKAMARDFDGDGDLDIATIAFFADYIRQPEEGFVYLENKGNFEFHPFSIPQAKVGRWLTMDAGDIDGDGKIDIVLGNFAAAPAFIKSVTPWKQGPQFLFLKNIGK